MIAATADWSEALRRFAAAETDRGVSAATIHRRDRQLRALAVDLEHGPFRSTREDILEAYQRRDVSPATLATYRDSLKAFYRWAHRTGRVYEQPFEEDHRAQRAPAPDQWAPELRAWVAALRSKGLSESTVELRHIHVRRIAADHAHRSPWDLTLDDLLEWFGARRWALETRRVARTSIRAFYAWGKTTKRIRRDPAKNLPVVKAKSPTPRPARVEDYAAAVAAAGPRERLALRLAMELGLRCAEVSRVHTSDIRGSAGDWSLVVRGKGDKLRVLPIGDALADSLRLRDAGYVFPGAIDGHLSPAHVGRVVNRLLPAATTMHQLRHRFATDAYAVDRDVFAVQRLLGHASPATTQRYVELPLDTLRATVDALRKRWVAS